MAATIDALAPEHVGERAGERRAVSATASVPAYMTTLVAAGLSPNCRVSSVSRACGE